MRKILAHNFYIGRVAGLEWRVTGFRIEMHTYRMEEWLIEWKNAQKLNGSNYGLQWMSHPFWASVYT